MKKFLKSLFIFVLIIPCLFLFSGCNEEQSIKIKDISRTAYTDTTVTYTITYEDDTTFSYTVPIENTVSISNIEKTSSVRNTDTYTITMSNEQTFTFTVTNGVSISDINYISNSDGQDCYEVKYTNGTNDYFYIDNKSSSSASLSLEELYETANVNGKYNDILEFIDDYLTINVNSDSKSVATSKAILSAVNITACYPSNHSYYTFSTSMGAGVIYQFDEASDTAYIITNCHVVYYEGIGYSDTVFAYVYGREGSPYEDTDQEGNTIIVGGDYGIECEVIGASIENDLAVLKAKKSDIIKNSPNARKVDVGNSEEVALSDDAIAIGNPEGEGMSVTYGTISVISEDITVDIDSSVETELREFRIDTAVNSGNSGGGLFNSKGELIGIVNAKAITESNSLNQGVITEGMGYALPSNAVISMVDNMIFNYIENGGFGIKKVLLGVTVYVDSSIAIYDNTNLVTKIVENVKVYSVVKGGIAEAIGFKEGEQIKKIYVNDVEYDITRMYQMIELVYTFRVGDRVEFQCLSGNKTTTYSYTIETTDFNSILA